MKAVGIARLGVSRFKGTFRNVPVLGERVMRRRVYFAMLGGWVVLLVILTSIPNPSFDAYIPYSDKVAHFGFYGVAGFFCALWRRESGRSGRRAVAFAALFVVLLGTADEVHQRWVPGRSMELLDWVADVAGGTTGAFLSIAAASRFPFLLSPEIQSTPRALTD